MTVSHLPEPGVILDLDLEERPDGERKPPFVVKVGQRSVTFKDPLDIDWRDLASVDIPADLLRVSLDSDDLEHLKGLELETWRFNKLMKSYYDYFGLEEQIQNARRRKQFSGF